MKTISILTLVGSGLLAVAARANTPYGWFDGCSPSSATVSTTITGNGWAADDTMGAPVQRVEIRVDGTTVLNATLGDSRPDVANAFGRSDFTYSGWHFSYAASNLSAGTHVFSAFAYNNAGESGELGNTWSVTVAANRAPSCGISVDGHSPGDTITRPNGGSASITVRYTASDPDGNLQGIRYNVWNSTTGYFDNGGGGFIGTGGNSGEVDRSVSLDSDGDWYFWTDAQDTMGAYASTGAWGAGFHIVVNQAAPANHPPQVNWASGSNTSPGGTTTLSGNVTDSDGNLQTAYFYINSPSLTGWQFIGTVGISGGNATPSLNYTFPSNAQGGTWMVTMRVIDASGAWDPDTNDIGYFNVNSPPSSSLSVSSTTITQGQSITLTSTITDGDGNLSNQAVDVSTDFNNWTSGWNNWSGTTAWNVSGSSATDYVTYTPPSTGTYYFRSRGQDTMGALSGFVYVTVTVNAATSAPTITSQPSSQTVNQGTSATFSVSASGNPSPGYQWYFNSSPISGATGSSYTIASAQPSNAGSYYVIVSNGVSPNATSSTATLTVVSPPVVTSPTSASGTVGAAFSYTITATNSPSSYGATGLPPGLTLSGATIGGTPTTAGTYNCTISASNSAGTGSGTLTITIAAAGPQNDTANQNQLNIHIP